MLDYRRMGNMVRHLENTTSTVSMHHFGDLWKRPRGTVLRIQALTVVAIIISFFIAAFGSCRRRSSRWIVQKGFFAAHALSFSLGTYSIGLMQSSSVKSEMYPIWTVSLFSLFVCIDPVTAYNGYDYKGPLSKMAYGICLNFGYVLLMSISTTSNNGVRRLSIIMLSAITFIKGFHGSLAVAQQSRMRKMLLQTNIESGYVEVLRYHYATLPESTKGRQKSIDQQVLRYHYATLPESTKGRHKSIDQPTIVGNFGSVSLADVDRLLKLKEDELSSCYDVCVALCLSQDLQQHFLGLGYGTSTPDPRALKDIKYKWALEVIEIELAFLFEVFFTGKSFFHYHQAKTFSLWALASFIGICFVGVAIAIPAGTTRRTNNYSNIGTGGCTKAVDTTTADLVMTFFILVSLGLLQLMHLIRCWTSNWARVAIACEYAKNHRLENECRGHSSYKTPYWRAWWMRLKALVATSTNWFDKNLWQNKIGQYSMLPEGRLTVEEEVKLEVMYTIFLKIWIRYPKVVAVYEKCVSLFTSGYKMLGVDYIWEVLWDLLGNDTKKKAAAVMLEDELKESVVDFLGKIESDRLDGIWLPSSLNHPTIQFCLPFCELEDFSIYYKPSHGYRYAECVMMWHAATWFCEVAELEQEQEKQGDAGAGCCLKKAAAVERVEKNRNRRVANALSKYCVHLVVSAPELLPGPVSETTKAYKQFEGKGVERYFKSVLFPSDLVDDRSSPTEAVLRARALAKVLRGDHSLHGATRWSDPWETLMHVWVRLLVYAAPYGNGEAHMRHLAQGGEFITHLWALLYHINIREWKLLVKEKNLHCLVTAEDLEKVLKENDHAAVIGIAYNKKAHYYDQVLAAASRMEHGVPFYQICYGRLATKFFDILISNKLVYVTKKKPRIVINKRIIFVNKEKFTLYDGDLNSAYDIARFVTALAKTREESTDVFASRRAQSSEDDEIEEESLDWGELLRNFANQSSEDDEIEEESLDWEDEIEEEGSHIEDEIDEESLDGGGQAEDEIDEEETKITDG